jgi:cell division septation protein DedD
MQLHKTEKARAALSQRTHALSMQERRILILSDGRRSLEDIAGLLGDDARPAALRLVEDRYLSPSPSPRATPPSSQALPRPAGTTTPAPPPPPAPKPPAAKRSYAATRMYMLDMLQLQRGDDARAIRAALQASAGHDAQVVVVVQALQYIGRVATPSYGRRVFERVAEILPEEALPALTARCGQMASAAAIAG